MIHLDNVLIISNTFDKHLSILEQVLIVFRAAGFKLKPSKPKQLRRKVQFLGHQISNKDMQPLEKNLKRINEFTVPQTVGQVRQLMELENFCYRHIAIDLRYLNLYLTY